VGAVSVSWWALELGRSGASGLGSDNNELAPVMMRAGDCVRPFVVVARRAEAESGVAAGERAREKEEKEKERESAQAKRRPQKQRHLGHRVKRQRHHWASKRTIGQRGHTTTSGPTKTARSNSVCAI